VFIRLETSSGVPINRQVADQIRAHCVNGTLAAGDRLPSVRELARDLAVNQNTILHVYERLTHEGLLERRQGDGTYVADKLPPGRARVQRDALLADMERLAHRVMGLGIEADQARQMFEEAFIRAQKERTGKSRGRAYG
jgi:GntR family transcriptional regulator